MKYAKMCKLIRVCTVRDLIVASWKKETKYTASHGNELEEGTQEGKNHQRHDEGRHCFYFSSFSFKITIIFADPTNTL